MHILSWSKTPTPDNLPIFPRWQPPLYSPDFSSSWRHTAPLTRSNTPPYPNSLISRRLWLKCLLGPTSLLIGTIRIYSRNRKLSFWTKFKGPRAWRSTPTAAARILGLLMGGFCSGMVRSGTILHIPRRIGELRWMVLGVLLFVSNIGAVCLYCVCLIAVLFELAQRLIISVFFFFFWESWIT